MKRILILSMLAFISTLTWGQDETINGNLNVNEDIQLGSSGEITLTSYQLNQSAGGQYDINPFAKLRLGRLSNNSNFSVDILRGNNTTDLQHVFSGYNHTYLNRLNGFVKVVGTTAPTEALDVTGNIRLSGTNPGIYSNSGSFTDRSRIVYHYGMTSHSDGYTNLSGYYGLHFFTKGLRRLTIEKEGNVGLGTTNPEAKLHIHNANSAGVPSLIVNNTYHSYGSGIEDNRPVVFRRLDSNKEALFTFVQDTKVHFLYQNDEASGSIDFRIKNSDTESGGGASSNDRVVLRLISNQNQGEVIVDGSLKAEEIKVELMAANNITYNSNGQTADFVFSDTYNLKPLSEVENFILTNKHLPEIPSAAQMEEQGVNLAEMNKLLLQKVEELTLYTIAQEEKLNQKSERIEKLEEARKKEKAEREKEQEAREKMEEALNVQSQKLKRLDSLEEEMNAVKKMIINLN